MMASNDTMNRQSRLYAALLMVFPFFVLFSPKINLLITHARLDELCLLIWLPLVIIHYRSICFNKFRPKAFPYFAGFLVMLMLFIFGLFYGDDIRRWSGENIRVVIRPLIITLYVLMLRYWIHKANITFNSVLMSLTVSISLAGGLGCFAMVNQPLADFLFQTYSLGVSDLSEQSRFDMALRAMSVFSGYDAASVTYAIGILIALYLAMSGKGGIRVVLGLVIISLIISIVTSARTGFVLATVGVMAFLGLSAIKLKAKIIMRSLVLLVLLICAGKFILVVFEDNPTVKRFGEIAKLLDITSSATVEERSESVAELLETHIRGVKYPHGIDVVFGFGDSGRFVSDSGYVNVYTKYGVFGIFLVVSVLTGWLLKSISESVRLRNFMLIPVNNVLSGLVVMFMLASVKGGLYFLTFKIGEIFALIIALAIVEAETASNPLQGTSSSLSLSMNERRPACEL